MCEELFDGEHSFTIERLAKNRVRFVQQEVFSGILVPLLGSTMSALERSYGEMNEALKTEAEKHLKAVSPQYCIYTSYTFSGNRYL